MPARAIIVQFILFVAYIAACTFWPAGTWNYPAAWVLLLEMTLGGIAITIWLAQHDPSLLRERMSSPLQKGQETWDRIFLMLLMLGFTAWLALSAWDAAQNDFVAVTVWLQAIGAV